MKKQLNQQRIQQPIPDNGFIVVASRSKIYLIGARYLANSIKDYWPEAHITLFTHDEWITDDIYNDFDHVIGGAPNHIRAKLWALSQTPYKNITAYLDADMEVVSEEVSNIFDQISEDADIAITKIRPYAGNGTKFNDGADELIDHGGMFLYRNNEQTIQFMQQWWEQYHQQFQAYKLQRRIHKDNEDVSEWERTKFDSKWLDVKPWDMLYWDQLTFYMLQYKSNYSINKEYIKDDARWNFVWAYKQEELNGKEPIIKHHTLPDIK